MVHQARPAERASASSSPREALRNVSKPVPTREELIERIEELELALSAYETADPTWVLPGCDAKWRPAERALLRVLYLRRPAIISVDGLSDIRGSDGEIGPTLIRVYMSTIRKKLRGTGWNLQNVWGSGYRLLGG